ncbi:MAG: HAMP domain-containing histidine kinase, partial [Candidatus Thorarchaeota archaeon]|nr:HAMP domain-containing histidine kinase [Candidatus Thorarchaeota archaeon]
GRITHQIVCLRSISKLLSESQKDVLDVLNTLVHLLPEGWQYPSDTCARIIWEEVVVASVNYQDTQWKQSTEIQGGDTVIGSLEICYLSEKPEADDGPFLFDEHSLLDTVGLELSSYLDRKQISIVKEQQHKELELYSSLLRHDLRNDIGIIVGNIEIAKLTMPIKDDAYYSLITTTEAVCQRMMSLLNVFSRAGNVSDTNLFAMVEKIIERTKEASPEMTITLLVEEDAKLAIIPESKLLPLVFDNLLRNTALHAGSAPNVTITISRNNRSLRIIIEDDGPGVANEVRDKLFQKGVSTRGGGLGLYLSKHVVETVGGSLELVQSRPGMGATFEIILPTIR